METFLTANEVKEIIENWYFHVYGSPIDSIFFELHGLEFCGITIVRKEV